MGDSKRHEQLDDLPPPYEASPSSSSHPPQVPSNRPSGGGAGYNGPPGAWGAGHNASMSPPPHQQPYGYPGPQYPQQYPPGQYDPQFHGQQQQQQQQQQQHPGQPGQGHGQGQAQGQGQQWHSGWQPSPFVYPRGYFCSKCQNTGVKRHNGQPCGTCERKFGRQGVAVNYAPPAQLVPVSTHYQYNPYGGAGTMTQTYMPVGGPPPGGVVYMAGDPRIGGRLCGNCKGMGIRSSMMGLVEEQCRICHGVGRIL